MKLGFTLHQITAGKARRDLPIGSVQAFADDEFDRLLKLAAVREPTDSELAIYEAINGKAEKAQNAAKGRKSTKAAPSEAKGADTVGGADEGSASNDPDEVDEI